MANSGSLTRPGEGKQRAADEIPEYRNLRDYLIQLSMTKLTDRCDEKVPAAKVPPQAPLPAEPREVELMIWVCNPKAAPLPEAANEAQDVSQSFPSKIHRGGTAEALRKELLLGSVRRLLFIGHADASQPGGPRTLGFVSEDGSMSVAPNEVLARMFGASAPANGGRLELVFINGCCSEPLGKLLRQHGVPVVVCWRTRSEDAAARIFSIAFFDALEKTGDHRRAFKEAESSVCTATKPGKLTCGIASGVTKYELRDPDAPPASSTTTAPAGIPVLLSD